MSVKVEAVVKAIALLKAAGAEYRIVREDGHVIQSEKYQVPLTSYLKKGKPTDGRKYQKTGINYRDIYLPVLKDVKPGEVAKVHIPAGVPPQYLSRSILSYCHGAWGSGTHITETHMDKDGRGWVEVLRVEKAAA